MPSRTSLGTGNGRSLPLTLRIALRELRGGIRGFYVFLACIALGVGAIAGVNSVSRAMTEGIAAEGRAILGGDLDFSLIHREMSDAEYAHVRSLGSVSTVATMRAIARRADGSDQALVELKAVDEAYPLLGTLRLDSGGDLHDALSAEEGRFGAVAAPDLLERLGVALGDTIALGQAELRLVDTIASEPDLLSSGIGFGPRLMVPIEALRATGLVRPGSLITWHYRAVAETPLSEAAIEAVRAAADERFPEAGWRIRSSDTASPRLQRNIRRFAQFLTLVGLTALVVGGVGVANAVASFVDLKRPAIATLKCLGAAGSLVFRIYFLQIGILALLGIAVGLAVGAALPPIAKIALADLLPIGDTAAAYPLELALAALYGALVAAGFSIAPLSRAREIPATGLFADRAIPSAVRPRRVYRLAQLAALLALAALAVGLSADRELALTFVGAVVAAFLVLRLVAALITFAAGRAGTIRGTTLRMAVRNIHRPGALTASVVLSLGLGLTLLVTLALIDTNLRNQLTETMAEEAPDFFFVDVQNAEKDAFLALLEETAPGGEINGAPMLRGRITALKGIAASDYKSPGGGRWVLRSDRGITYSDTVPENSTLVKGEWWQPGHEGDNLVSIDDEVATELGLDLGDTISVNVLGRTVTATIANTRAVEWESLAINFFMVFSPNTFRGAPHAHLATLRLPETGDPAANDAAARAVLGAVTRAFPGVTSVRVADALNAVSALIGDIALAVRVAASLAVVISILVLGGALAAGHRQRRQDAVVLKALGATRARLLSAFALEYGLLGLATAVFGIAAGAVAAWYVVSQVMEIEFTMFAGVAFSAALIALCVTLGLGLAGTWRILSVKAAPYLRNL